MADEHAGLGSGICCVINKLLVLFLRKIVFSGVAVDVDGLVNGWNMKIAELTGLPVDKAIGMHLLSLVEDTSADIVKKMLSAALQGMSYLNC